MPTITAGPGRDRAATVVLSVLLFLLPFEPRRYTLRLLDLELTLLELAAAVAMAVLLWANRGRLRAALVPVPAPLAALAAFAGAHLLSAALAPSNQGLAFLFSLRMAAALALAVLVAATSRASLPTALAASAAGACVVAILAVLEGSGVRFTDPWLAWFRAQPFWIGDARRASGTSENPNLAADVLMHGLLAALALSGTKLYRPQVAYVLAALLASGLLMTHSRGAVLAALLSLFLLTATARGPRAGVVRAGALIALAAGAGTVVALGADASWRRVSEVDGSGYDARYDLEDDFLGLRPGEARRVRIQLTNSGSRAWGRGFQPSLTHMWYDLDQRAAVYASRAALPVKVVPAGGSVTFDAEVQAPRLAGRYLLIWDIGWQEAGTFSSFGIEPAVLPVAVGEGASAPFQVTLPRGIWKRGRIEMWRLAIAMWRAHPLTGVGPDNYRWLHGAYGGWLTWSVLNRADSAYLEIAATTGALGLACFLAILSLTAAGAWRHLSGSSGDDRAVSAAVLASIAGIAVHGVVDHSLPFTGHYLFLAFLVGAASHRHASQST